MKRNHLMKMRVVLILTMMLSLSLFSARKLRADVEDTGTCGGQSVTLPFSDVLSSNVFFCSIAAAYVTGLTNGATPTTYSPQANVTREQMAAFITRTLDQSVKRSSRRAALGQFWNPQEANSLTLTNVGASPNLVKSDGADLWTANRDSNTVSRVRASDGRLLETWTGASSANGVLCAMGKVFVTGSTAPGKLYQIDPTQPAGAVTTLSSGLGNGPQGIAYDGQRIWTANFTLNSGGSISIITLNSANPPSVINIMAGFSHPEGIVFDGLNIWVTDLGDETLKKLDAMGNVLQSIPVGTDPRHPVFDGTNLWVPNFTSNAVTVVRATGSLSGTVLATLTGNGLYGPAQAAFDGERILVTNLYGDSVSLWKASDLTPTGTFPAGAGTHPFGVCSDGVNFWVTFYITGKLARF